MNDDTEAGARLLSPPPRTPTATTASASASVSAPAGPGRRQPQRHHQQRQRILCYDRRYFCRVTLWLELMVGIIMTILGLFILLLSIESLKEGDYPAVYFCSSFIVLGVVLLFVYYVHYYALKYSIKRHVQRLDASIKSDQDALAALARRSLQLSKIAVPRKDPPELTPEVIPSPQPSPPHQTQLMEETALVIPARLGAALPQSFSDFDLWDARQSDV